MAKRKQREFMYGETKAEFRDRLNAEGRWGAFEDRKRHHRKRYGCSPADSYRITAEKFAPLEVPEEFGESDATSDGLYSIPDNQDGGAGGIPIGKRPTWEGLKDIKPLEESSLVDEYKPDELNSSMFSSKRKASAKEVVLWIFDNIDIVDVGPKDAPSSGAWSFLIQMRKDNALRREFYRSIWPRLLPSRSQIELEESMFDDGREDATIINRISALVADEEEDVGIGDLGPESVVPREVEQRNGKHS